MLRGCLLSTVFVTADNFTCEEGVLDAKGFPGLWLSSTGSTYIFMGILGCLSLQLSSDFLSGWVGMGRGY